MARPTRQELRQVFEGILTNLWNKWDEKKVPENEQDEVGESPFEGTYWMEFTDLTDSEKESVRWDMGWMDGVHAATGWSLHRPGPREWSPRER